MHPEAFPRECRLGDDGVIAVSVVPSDLRVDPPTIVVTDDNVDANWHRRQQNVSLRSHAAERTRPSVSVRRHQLRRAQHPLRPALFPPSENTALALFLHQHSRFPQLLHLVLCLSQIAGQNLLIVLS